MKYLGALLLMSILFIASGCNPFDSPERAAREWIEAVYNQDGLALEESTCSRFQEVVQDAGLRVSTFSLLGEMITGQEVEADLSGLNFQTIEKEYNTVKVQVTGKIRVAIRLIVDTQEISEVWVMHKEDGKWRWCGSWHEVVTEEFNESLNGASSAEIEINLDYGDNSILALVSSNNLFETQITHDGLVNFSTAGNDHKKIQLDIENVYQYEEPEIRTVISLSPNVPLDLDINLGTGHSNNSLTSLKLSKLNAGIGNGYLNISLPSGGYPVKLSIGKGELTIETQPDTNLDMEIHYGSGNVLITIADRNQGYLRIDGGSGSITLEVPIGISIQLTGSTGGSGKVLLPPAFVQIQESELGYGVTSGIWKSSDLDFTNDTLVIEFDIGSGTLEIRSQIP